MVGAGASFGVRGQEPMSILDDGAEVGMLVDCVSLRLGESNGIDERGLCSWKGRGSGSKPAE